jgi:hypothetical protein
VNWNCNLLDNNTLRYPVAASGWSDHRDEDRSANTRFTGMPKLSTPQDKGKANRNPLQQEKEM